LGTITSNPGTYQLVLEKSNGCDSIILQTLSVLSNPMTEEERFFCFGDSLQVYDSLFTNSGSITRVFSASNGCDSTHVVSVIEKILPNLVPLDTIFGTYGQIITLTGPNGFVTYIWEPSPTPPCPNCPSVSYPEDSVGYQEYLLTVAGSDGCPGELLFRVVVVPPCSADSLFIPNAFTPNGDGANDMFQVVKREGAEVVSSLDIYDRWGEKVYEAQGDAAWDGTIYGKPAPSDVYVYIVKVRCGELIGKRVGDVTLLR
jgi:gliding motility-associated-like protein